MERHHSGDPEEVVSEWKEFYTRARDLRNKGEEVVEKVEPYAFPKDDDPMLYEACDALSDALQKASEAKVEYDTAEVKQALDNLRNAYDEAAKSNTVIVRYINVEPPSEPDPNLKRILLVRS